MAKAGVVSDDRRVEPRTCGPLVAIRERWKKCGSKKNHDDKFSCIDMTSQQVMNLVPGA